MQNAKSTPLVEVRRLTKTFSRGQFWEARTTSRVLDAVDLMIEAGETLALVGASGSGKTTLAMCLALLEAPDAGEIFLDGKDLLRPENRGQHARRSIQMIFQDSTSALNPNFTAAQIVEEPLRIQGLWSSRERSEMVSQLMNRVGLSPAWKYRRPDQLSGGQRQRVAIARALAALPRLLILDEPFTGLDLSIRGQIVNLLTELQAECRLTYLYISHDLELVRYFANRVAIMQNGKVMPASLSADLVQASNPANLQKVLSHQPIHSEATWE